MLFRNTEVLRLGLMWIFIDTKSSLRGGTTKQSLLDCHVISLRYIPRNDKVLNII